MSPVVTAQVAGPKTILNEPVHRLLVKGEIHNFLMKTVGQVKQTIKAKQTSEQTGMREVSNENYLHQRELPGGKVWEEHHQPQGLVKGPKSWMLGTETSEDGLLGARPALPLGCKRSLCSFLLSPGQKSCSRSPQHPSTVISPPRSPQKTVVTGPREKQQPPPSSSHCSPLLAPEGPNPAVVAAHSGG